MTSTHHNTIHTDYLTEGNKKKPRSQEPSAASFGASLASLDDDLDDLLRVAYSLQFSFVDEGDSLNV